MKTTDEQLREVNMQIDYHEINLQEAKNEEIQRYIDYHQNKLDIYKSIKATLESVKGK